MESSLAPGTIYLKYVLYIFYLLYLI